MVLKDLGSHLGSGMPNVRERGEILFFTITTTQRLRLTIHLK